MGERAAAGTRWSVARLAVGLAVGLGATLLVQLALVPEARAQSIDVAIGVSADPARPGEVLDVAITVTNSGGSPASGLTLEAPFLAPGLDELDNLNQNLATDGGNCTGGGTTSVCEPGDRLVWQIPTLAPGTGRTFRFAPRVSDDADASIAFSAEVFDGLSELASDETTVAVEADPALELRVVESADPVGPGELLTYTLTFGHRIPDATAPDAVLSLTLPPGVTVEAIGDGGMASGGVVTWDLGTLAPGQAGERQVTVAVDDLAVEGSLLEAQAVIEDASLQAAQAGSVVRVRGGTSLALEVVASPDPARPGEVTDVAVTVSNRGGFDLSDVAVLLQYPEDLANVSQALANEGGDCRGRGTTSVCEPQDRLVWSVGTLEPGLGRTLRVPPRIAAGLPDGSLVPLVAWASESGGEFAEAGATPVVEADPALELRVVESADPVGPGETLTYTLTFGHRIPDATAPDAVLSLELPPGVTVEAIGDGGIASGGVVTWDLGTLAPGQAGERQVTVAVDDLAVEGSLLEAQAVIADASLQAARVGSVVRVRGDTDLALEVVASPDPARPGEVTDVAVTVSNRGGFDLFDVAVLLQYPEDLANVNQALANEGGDCRGRGTTSVCEPQDRLVWSVGTLEPGVGRTLRVPPRIAAELPDGSLVPLVAWASESGGEFAEAGATPVVEADPALELRVVESADPVGPGETLTYTLTFGHRIPDATAPDAVLSLELPPGVTVEAIGDGGMASGGVVTWDLGTLAPGQAGERQVTVAVDDLAVEGSLLEAEATIADASLQAARAGSVVRVRGDTDLALEVVASPDPARPGEVADVAVTVSNRGGFDLFDVAVALQYPEDLANVNQALANEGGNCTGRGTTSVCEPQDRLVWSVGTLEPGVGRTLRVPPQIAAGLPDGSLVPLVAWASESGGEFAEAGATPVVEADPALELRVVESADPVGPGETLTYTLALANGSTSQAATSLDLDVALPSEAQLLSVSAGGQSLGDTVWWTINTLEPGTIATRTLTVRVDSGLMDGELVKLGARFDGFFGTAVTGGAATVTRVDATPPLRVAVSIPGGTFEQGDSLPATVDVTNPTGFPLFEVVIELHLPAGVQPISESIFAGMCPGNTCDPGERIVWMLPMLEAGQTVELDLPLLLAADLPEGTLLELDARAREAGGAESLEDRLLLVPEPTAWLQILAVSVALLALRAARRSTVGETRAP